MFLIPVMSRLAAATGAKAGASPSAVAPGLRGGSRRPVAAGFTLMELMIVVAIVGILAAIAYPSYMDSIVKSRRGAAKACLTNYATHMERYYTTNMRYTDAGGDAPALPALDCASDTDDHYTYSFDGDPTATTFALKAVPKGAQLSRDTLCGTLFIDQTGARSVSTGSSNCW